MSPSFRLAVRNHDLSAAVREFLGAILEQEMVSGMLVPQHLPMNKLVMPTLVIDPRNLEGADPLAPAFALNAAKLVSRLTEPPTDRTIAAVLRPCEIRAFRERVKFNQGDHERVIAISVDCLGAMPNADYLLFAGEDKRGATRRFCEIMLAGGEAEADALPLASACRACEAPASEEADIALGLWGAAPAGFICVTPQTEKGEELLKKLNLEPCAAPPERESILRETIRKRIEYRDRMFAAARAATATPAKLSEYLAGCVNCYNCRAACPVCYCRECVFLTDVFHHTSRQYFNWAERKGVLKMPTDTLFFHLTRLAHMSLSCVGCGQCSNACPNGIGVMELFRTAAHEVQREFDYHPGRDVAEPPPLAVFREDEYPDVAGE